MENGIRNVLSRSAGPCCSTCDAKRNDGLRVNGGDGVLAVSLVVGSGWTVGFDIDRGEVVDGFRESITEFHRGLPLEVFLGERNVGTSPCRIILRQRLVGDFRFRVGEFDNQFGELFDGVFPGVANIDRADDFVGVVHHANDAFY